MYEPVIAPLDAIFTLHIIADEAFITKIVPKDVEHLNK